MKRRGDGWRISKARRVPCEVRLDRLIFGATGLKPSSLLEIEGFRVVADFRPHPQGKIPTYKRVRKFRSVGSSSQIVSQYEPLVPWVDQCRVTMIADDVRGLALEEVEAATAHFSNHRLSVVELAFDFVEDAGVDRKFVLQHGVFGKSRRQPNPAGQGYVRYGTRASAKLVRCYRKHQLNRFRVELEFHLRMNSTTASDRLPQAPRTGSPPSGCFRPGRSLANDLPASDCDSSSNRNNHASRFHWMFHQLVGACYLVQRDNLCDVESLPPASSDLLMSRVASIFASAGTSSLPTKKSLAFTNTSCQTGVSGVGVLVA